MNQWALAAIAVLLIGYGALSERLQCTTVTQAMAFIEATLTLVLFTYLDLWTAAALASILTPPTWPMPPQVIWASAAPSTH